MRPVTHGLAISAALFVLSLTLPLSAFAQMRNTTAPPDSLLHIYAVVPLIGTGTVADPTRPMFAPAQGIQPVLPVAVAAPAPGVAAAAVTPRSGIIAYHMQVSDDGKQAIVEFMAVSKNDVQPILTSVEAGVQVFIKGVHAQSVILAAFQAVKKDFSFDKFGAPGVR